MATCISRSPEETVALGEAWGRAAQPGWVLALSGDLGAGKTLLVKGLARGLGAPERVLSPTFALVNQYLGGRLPLFHLDLYRLNSPEEIIRAGLEDFFWPRHGVTAVEWAEKWYDAGETRPAGLGPSSRRIRRVWLQSIDSRQRRISYEDVGP